MRRTRSARWGRLSLFVSMTAFAALVIPFAGPAAANHEERVLDVVPDTADLGIGTTHTLTAKLCALGATPGSAASTPDSTDCDDSAATFDTGPINIDFEFEGLVPIPGTSANDPDNGTSYQTPDMTCSVFAGQSSCQVSYLGAESGDDQIRAWIDHDGSNSTVEADTTEQQDERATPGSQSPGTNPFSLNCFASGPAEEDCTDVVTASWEAGAPAVLDCDDENGPNREQETNPGGGAQGNETYLCSAYDAQGNLTGDADAGAGEETIVVKGEFKNGVNDPDDPDSESYSSPDRTCEIEDSGGDFGTCEITVTQGEGDEGTAFICFWIGDETAGQTLCSNESTMEGTNPDGSDDFRTPGNGGDKADQVEKTWENRSANGGGVDAEPETATNDKGTNHTITATVYDQFGDSLPGNTTVNFEFFSGSPSDTDGNTPGTPDMTCSTSSTSSCSRTYTSNEAGRDLVCVWTNAAPNMQGNNQAGTCDGEGRDDTDDAAGSADAPDPRNDDVDVVSKTWVNADPATELNCIPENATTERTSNHVITCTASNESGGVADTNIDVEATGANDPDSSSTPGTPDFSCTTDNDGDCTVTHNGGAGNSLGTTTYRAWIDSDYKDDTNESDQGEGVDESQAGQEGDTEEPDNTDVVRNTWIADPERTISLDSNGNSRREGRKIRLFGDVEGDPACEDAETVRLRRRSQGASKFKTIATTVTDNNGGYEFEVVVRRTSDYKTVAPPTTTPNACNKASSNVVTITLKQ